MFILKMVHELPELGYEYDSLEPFMDAQTVEIHRTKHHQGYVDKLNKALEGHPDLQEKTIQELITNINKVPEEIKTAIMNNGAQILNHSLFFDILKKDIKIPKELLKAIDDDFKSFEDFKKEFSEAAATQFGSGWAWLVVSNGKLEIIKTSNEQTPLLENKRPILVIDVWEHAYYLKYQNKRPEYIDNFFNIINWKKVNELYLQNQK